MPGLLVTDCTCSFEIHNDGSPVDIMLSHGSDGSTGGSGACSVIIHKVLIRLFNTLCLNQLTLWQDELR
jgi:hypothetical protein